MKRTLGPILGMLFGLFVVVGGTAYLSTRSVEATVTSTTARVFYTGNGSQTVFAYTFKIQSASELRVVTRNNTTGVETVQALTTHYTVGGVGVANGGSVTFVTAPTSGHIVMIRRYTPLLQPTDLKNQDRYDPARVETALDNLCFEIQRMETEIARVIRAPESENNVGTSLALPQASLRANKVLGFDSLGNVEMQDGGGGGGGGGADALNDLDDVTINSAANRDILINNGAGQWIDDVLVAGDIPPLAASKITSGEFPTARIANDAITYDKIQNVTATDRILGRVTSGAGNTEEVAVASPLTLASDSLDLDETVALGNNARVAVQEDGAGGGTRRKINFHEGSGVTITLADDAGAEEVDVTIAASGGGGGTLTIEENNGTVLASATTLNFNSIFNVTDAGSNQADVTLDIASPLVISSGTIDFDEGTSLNITGLWSFSRNNSSVEFLALSNAGAGELGMSVDGVYKFELGANDGILDCEPLTSARTWYMPNLSGTVSVLGNATTGTDAIVLENAPVLISPSVTSYVLLKDQAELRLSEATANGTQYVSLKAPSSLATSYTLTYPAVVPPGANVILEYNASGVATWITTPGGAGATALNDLTDVIITAPDGTGQRDVLLYNGSEWADVNLTAADIPDLSATYLPLAGGTMAGNIILNDGTELRFHDAAGSGYVGFKAPATLTGDINYTITLPVVAGSGGGSSTVAGDVLTFSDTSGTTIWVASNGSGSFARTTNTTLTTPTISDLTNATHSHLNAAGGGNLTAGAITSGDFTAVLDFSCDIASNQVLRFENINAGGALSISVDGLVKLERGAFDGYFDASTSGSDKTWTFPNTTGTVTVLGNTTTGTGSTIVLNGAPTLAGANLSDTLNVEDEKALRLGDAAGSGYVALKAPATITADATYTLTFPAADPGANQILESDTDGNLSWINTPAGGGGVSDGDKGDVVVSSSGTVWDVDAGVITATEIATDGVSADELNATGVETELEAVLDIDQLQGTAGAANLGTDSVSADELNAAGVESELEAVLDINELQGEAGAANLAADSVGDSELDGTADFDITGSVTLDSDALQIDDTNASHQLVITPGSDLTADRVLTLTTGDAARTLTLSDNATLNDADYGDITTSSDFTAWAIDNDAVTYAKIQNVTESRMLGRGQGSGDGDTQELTAGSGVSLSGTALQIDVNELTADLDPSAFNDSMATYDASAGAPKKVALRHAVPLINPRRYAVMPFEEYMNASTGIGGGRAQVTNGGAGAGLSAASLAETTTLGINVTISTGTTNTGAGSVGTSTGANTGFGAARFRTYAKVRVPNLSDGVEIYILGSGFVDTITTTAASGGLTCVDAIAFRYTHSENGGEWVAYTRENSNGLFPNPTNETLLDTNVLVAANTWYVLEMDIAADASTVDFYIDGTAVGQITTNIPDGSSRLASWFPCVMTKNGGSTGTTARTAILDYDGFVAEFTSLR